VAALKPQDVLVALKYAARPQPWKQRHLADAIGLSVSEVNHARQRLIASRLFNEREDRVIRPALLELLTFGVRYVFPAQLGAPSVGMPTAFSARPLSSLLVGGADVAVWPSDEGNVSGRRVDPLYRTVPEAAARDAVLYEYLALVDALRVGRARDRSLAKDELVKRLRS
jgi:hypothetical protein